MKIIKKIILSFLTLTAFFLLTACGGGGGGSAGSSSDAFSVSPGSLTFSAQLGGTAPSSQSITISPNQTSTAIPDITASGSAIDFGSTSSCVGGNSANLSCTRTGSDIVVTVPAPDPDNLGVGSYNGSILLSSSQHSVTVNVTYTVAGATPVVSQVSPYLAEVGQSHTVTIRGGGFSNFGSTTPVVSFGSTAGTSATVINDSTITVAIPGSLAAGSHNVSVTGASVTFPSTAKLVVVNTPAYAAASIDLASIPRLKYLYDDQRQVLFAANALDGVLEKYTSTGTAWNTTPTTLPLTGIADMVLSTDGSTLFVVKHNSHVYEIDPDTFTQRSAVEVKAPVFGSLNCNNDNCFDSAAISSDGSGVFLDSNQFRDMYFYNAETNTAITSRDAGYKDNTISIWNAKLHRSASGDRIFINGQSNDYIFNAAQKNITLLSGVTGSPTVLNSDGRVIVSGTSVLKDTGSGYIAYATLPVTPTMTAVSRDGNKAYVYDGTVLKVYDISTATVTQIGSDITLATSPGTPIGMLVTANGSTAFIYGYTNLVVVPIP